MPNCEYKYLDTFETYGRKIRDILLNDSTIPYKVYENINDYKNDNHSKFKGLLIWETDKYYKGTLFNLNKNNNSVIDFFVVPEFGEAIYSFPAINQIFTISFDYLGIKDKYGKKTIELIHWFINKHKQEVENINLTLPSNDNLIVRLKSISKPINQESAYIRRTIVYQLIYCVC